MVTSEGKESEEQEFQAQRAGKFMSQAALNPPITPEEWSAWDVAVVHVRSKEYTPGQEPLFDGSHDGPTLERTSDGYIVRGIAQYKLDSFADTWDGVGDWMVQLRNKAGGGFTVMNEAEDH